MVHIGFTHVRRSHMDLVEIIGLKGLNLVFFKVLALERG
jgi:hypothetical protein